MTAIGLGWLCLGWGPFFLETKYGLMQHSPFEIKERLLKALDKEYNVVDMGTVLEVVGLLERTPITKEALETTRLGRDINELRRKTKNELLAKRAKDLVRKWRDMILPPQPASDAGQPTGGASTVPTLGPASEPVATPVTIAQHNGGQRGGQRATVAKMKPVSPAVSLPPSERSVTSPVLTSSRLVDPVPKTHAANKRLRKAHTPASSPPAPLASHIPHATTPELPPSKRVKTESHKTSKSGETRLNGEHYDSVGSDCEIVSFTPAPTPQKHKSRKKAPKDRTKKNRGGEDIVKEKIASIARIPKVKTTEELIAGLKSKAGGEGGEPASGVNAMDHDVARNKTEHIARFLRSGDGDGDEVEVIDVDGDEADSKKSEVKEEVRVPTTAPVEPAPTAEEILARLPPLDLDSIRWEESPLPSPTPQPVTEEDVDRVLSQQIEGLNGNFEQREETENSEFREWHQVVTRTSLNSELIYVLPYVIID